MLDKIVNWSLFALFAVAITANLVGCGSTTSAPVPETYVEGVVTDVIAIPEYYVMVHLEDGRIFRFYSPGSLLVTFKQGVSNRIYHRNETLLRVEYDHQSPKQNKEWFEEDQ